METLSNYTPLILILLVFYFFILAPQLKRNKKEKQFSANLKKGDRVITKSGMHGKIAALNDKTTLVWLKLWLVKLNLNDLRCPLR